MFERCQNRSGSGGGNSSTGGNGPRCVDVAEKLAQLFGWRQTYRVEKLQRTLATSPTRHHVHAHSVSVAPAHWRKAQTLDRRRSAIPVPAAASEAAGAEAEQPYKREVQTLDRRSSSNRRNQASSGWVEVHALQTRDGGLLDPDDRLRDVADDREQLVAAFSSGAAPGGGDGASASSAGSGSPDLLQGEVADIEVPGGVPAPGAGGLQVRRGSEPALHRLAAADAAKRWSAAPLIHDESPPPRTPQGRGNRGGNGWDAPQEEERTHDERDARRDDNDNDAEEERAARARLARDGAGRLSMQFGGGAGAASALRWAEAAERVAAGPPPAPAPGPGQSRSLPRDHRRREPLGQAAPPPPRASPVPKPVLAPGASPAPPAATSGPAAHEPSHPTASVAAVSVSDPEDDDDDEDDCTELVVLRPGAGPLGIHVVPEYGPRGGARGLLLQGVEPGGRAHADGRLALGDRIVQINGRDLRGLPLHRVEDVFKAALASPELRLRVVRRHLRAQRRERRERERERELQQPQLRGRSSATSTGAPSPGPGAGAGVAPSSMTATSAAMAAGRPVGARSVQEPTRKPPAPVFPRARPFDDPVGMVEGEQRPEVSLGTKVATVSPTKKVSPGGPVARVAGAGTLLLAANTRRLGRRLELELEKGAHGLGFSITTRDNPAGGDGPVYIKNILPKGAAVEDGRLRPGDRLLEVNGDEMTGKSQAEAVAVLRSAPPGSRVRIVVSRQEEGGGSGGSSGTGGGTSPRLPRQLGSAVAAATEDAPATASEQTAAHAARAAPPVTQEPTEKAEDDALLYPWKHKEILTFDIPVHDTEKAGLGVSVKGKTTTGHGHSSSHNGSSSSNNSSGANSSGGSGGSVDLGIFVKSVLHGGAASRDGRLLTNDQLLNVNGVSLLGQSNADAMETLRRAMLHTDGPVPGVITLTVARRSNSSNSSGHSGLMNGHASMRSNGAERSAMELNKFDGDACTPDHSGTSENSDNTVIFLPFSHPLREDSRDLSAISKLSGGSRSETKHVPLDVMSTRNPVLDRLTGQVSNAHALRNESYYRATNDTWNTTMMLSGTTGDKMSSPTVNQSPGEIVLIEEEYLPFPSKRQQERPGIEKVNGAKWNERVSDTRAPSEPGSEIPTADATYASQLSLEEAAACFSRDAFGRQSMSEKRHAALDAKNTDTYQRNKRLREERERQRQLQQEQQKMNERNRENRSSGEAKVHHEFMVRANSIESIISLTRSQADSERSAARALEFGPALGMKKSSSLESLQTLVQELQMQEEYGYQGGSGSNRGGRTRGCNESFRAAVDRSYEAPLAELRSRLEMETYGRRDWPAFFPRLVTEEDGATEDGGGGGNIGGFGGGVGILRDGAGPGDPLAVPLAFAVRGGPRQSSLNAALDAKHKSGKKKPGLLRGIGSMFRFGKHRKTAEEDAGLHDAPEHRASDGPGGGAGGCVGPSNNVSNAAAERAAARRAAEEEQQRIQEQYRRLQQQQQQQQQRQRQTEGGGGTTITTNSISNSGGGGGSSVPAGVHPQHPRDGSSSSSSAGVGGGSGCTAPPQSRVERIHELRAQHQRRHAERRGRYPQDAREERYEEAIRQHLEDSEPAGSGVSTNYDLYGEMGRPGSRAGISDPTRFSHYVNYEEIQLHLSKHRERLSEVQIKQMREQVQRQRYKVEEESRRQQHYHSQRRETREPNRPISNYYEYESIQGAARPAHQWNSTVAAAADTNSNSLPRHAPSEWAHKNNNNGPYSNQQKIYQTAQSAGSSNFRLAAATKRDVPLPMVHNIRGTNKNTNLPSRPQGPFVTQVLIGEQLPAPGSKV